MKIDKSERKDKKTIPVSPITKASKVQEYVKKNCKNNWSNTKSVYTRPR